MTSELVHDEAVRYFRRVDRQRERAIDRADYEIDRRHEYKRILDGYPEGHPQRERIQEQINRMKQ